MCLIYPYMYTYTHICMYHKHTHTHIYMCHKHVGKMRRKFPAGRQGLPRRKIKRSTHRHFMYFSLDTEVFPVLVDKSRAILVAFMLSNIRRKD